MSRPAAILFAIALSACRTGPVIPVEPPPPRLDMRSFMQSKWLPAEELTALTENEMLLAAWSDSQRADGTTAVFLPIRRNDGTVLEKQRSVTAANAFQNAGMQSVLVVPLFLGTPRTAEESPVRLSGSPWDGSCPRISPTSTRVRANNLRLLREIADKPMDALCISHAGFPSIDTDFNNTTRFAFESFLGKAIPDWPDSVASLDKDGDLLRGPLWDRWIFWRAAFLANHLVSCRKAFDEARLNAGLEAVPVILMVNGYYSLHTHESLNWATASALRQSRFPNAPSNYNITAIGDRFDALLLECFAPLPREADATASGYEAWSSVRGAVRAAEKLTGDMQLLVAISREAYSGPDGMLNNEEELFLNETLSVLESPDIGVLMID